MTLNEQKDFKRIKINKFKITIFFFIVIFLLAVSDV